MAALFLVHCGICKVVAPDTGLAAAWVGGEKLCPLFTLRGRNLFSSSSLFCILHINEMFLRGMGKIDTGQCRAPNFSLNWSQSSFRGTRALKSIFGRGTILGVPGGKNFGGRSPLPCCTQGQNRMEREEKRMGWEGDGRDVGLIAAQNLGPMALVQISLPSSLLSMGSVQMALHASIGETDARFSGSN